MERASPLLRDVPNREWRVDVFKSFQERFATLTVNPARQQGRQPVFRLAQSSPRSASRWLNFNCAK
jgi:hypothetical protein